MTTPPSTLWHAAMPAPAARPPLAGDISVEVAIVGGGITGLSTALALAQAGTGCLVLEARRLGWGASGRSAGFVVPGFSRTDPAALRARLGPEGSERLLRLVSVGAERVFDFARAHGLGAAAEQAGWLQPAHSAAAAETLRARVADWQALGRSVSWLSSAETTARTGSRLYHGALHDASGGVVDPLAYLRALARAAEAQGGRIHEHTTATSIDRDGTGWRIATEAGPTVRAGRVLLCTNADATGAGARLARGVVPLSVYQIATEPLDPATVARISPRREPVSDTRANIFTYRLSSDDRLISGGMALLPLGAERRMARRIVARLAAELSLARVPRVTNVWRGTAAMTMDALPHIYEFAPGWLGAIGCNGRGIAMTSALGPVLARALSDGCAADDLPVPQASARAVPFRAASRAMPSLVLARGLWQDRAVMRKPHGRTSSPPSQTTKESDP